MRAVDLFSGWGGLTEGAFQAGVDVVYAANHWPRAVEIHSANHPSVEHVCQDLRQADWTRLPSYELLLAAPACQGHSLASRGKRRPYHDAMRATAWAVVDCAEITEPCAVVVENVPEFRAWKLYDIWTSALERLGYSMSETIVRASYVGVPQRRDRLFVVGTRKPRPIHLHVPETDEPSFAPCIEWDAPGWRPITQAKKGGRSRIVDGERYRPLTIRELARGMGFPETYRWPDGLARWEAIRGIGNAVCPPVAREVVRQVAAAA